MSQPEHVIALELDLPENSDLPDDLQSYFALCDTKLGMVPNVLRAYSHNAEKLRAFSRYYNTLMLGESGLTKLEREMIAVVVSARNHCFYCQTAHGAAVRGLSGDPVLGELMVMNYQAAELSHRHRAMLDFAVKITERSHTITESDRALLRDAGFEDQEIWDIAEVAAFFNMSNRLASAVDMQPNPEYHSQFRATGEA